MKLKVLSFFATLLISITASAQFTWSDIGTSVSTVPVVTGNSNNGTVTVGVANPNPSGINLTSTTNQFNKLATSNSLLKGTLPNPILAADVTSTIIKIKIYFAEFDDLPNTVLRMYLGETASVNTNRKIVTLAFDEADEGTWKEYTFDFSTASGDFNTQYDNFQLFFNQGVDNVAATYYFDGVSGTSDQEYLLSPAAAVLDTDNDWYYNNSPDTFGVTFTTGGTVNPSLSHNETTPSVAGNDSPTVSLFTKDAPSANGFFKFDFPGEIIAADQAKAIFKIRIHTPATATGTSLRMNLRKNGENAGTTQITYTVGNSSIIPGRWQEYTFDFSGITFKHTSYDTALLFILDTGDDTSTNNYYFDALQGPGSSVLAIENTTVNTTDINIYPTLVDNTFSINAEINSAEVYNLTGQKVITYGNQSSFDASGLASGVYFFHAHLTNGTSQTIRFVKN